MLRVVAHGGTGSDPRQKDGPTKAAQAGLAALRRDGPVAAVTEAVRILENDPRFNAGTGSAYRFDGRTIEMDAAVVDEEGRFGAVAGIREVRNPVLVARSLMGLPTNVVCGDAAVAYARRLGMPPHDPGTAKRRASYRKLIADVRDGSAPPAENQWDADALRRAWNYAVPFEDVFPKGFPPSKGERAMRSSDTVGAVATDGRRFAAAASTGGTTTTLLGRVGDTPTFGAGLMASHHGAVAFTGAGDVILRERLAGRVAEWLADGATPDECLARAKARLPSWADFCMVVVTQHAHAAGGNRSMAWSMQEAET